MDRRSFLTRIGAGSCGLSLAGLLQARAAAEIAGNGGAARIKSCIVVFYYGGPSHLDTFDLKPHAPAEVRGEFRFAEAGQNDAWAHPVIHQGRLYLRYHERLVCFGVGL